jgi:hypothetical protein
LHTSSFEIAIDLVIAFENHSQGAFLPLLILSAAVGSDRAVIC